jgi:hypothetical protein
LAHLPERKERVEERGNGKRRSLERGREKREGLGE